jgi:hypothetical protein
MAGPVKTIPGVLYACQVVRREKKHTQACRYLKGKWTKIIRNYE